MVSQVFADIHSFMWDSLQEEVDMRWLDTLCWHHQTYFIEATFNVLIKHLFDDMSFAS